MLYYLIATLYVLTCLVLMLVILLQQGKGGDIANAFGGGSSQAAFGARSGATVLSRATTVCAVLFVVGALVLGIVGQRGPGSVIGGPASAGPFDLTHLRKWRNWQTHQLEGLAVAIPWGFESPLPHHSTRLLRFASRRLAHGRPANGVLRERRSRESKGIPTSPNPD